ncbi:MAG: energy-coupling factor ABC transporter ATP-binding protein [Anaerolineae bacterium]|nr:energy-coupling factor ABC transporter ATP-binding protein [Anaerolineae bacterium]
MAFINLNRFSFVYAAADAPALKDISLEIQQGQILGVVGANGSGKTSLCLALAGMIPTVYHGDLQGEIKIMGMDPRESSVGDFAGKLGMVLQNPLNQLSGMCYTVFEEVAFGLGNLGVPAHEMPERIYRVLKWVGLEHVKERSPFSLSGGQPQRLVLACILAMQPAVLILDEPTAYLDPQGSRALFEIIQTLARSGTTVIITGFTLEWMAHFADRIIALSHGQIILDGVPDQVLASPELPAVGIGWQRYTRAAHLAGPLNLWPENMPLPVTLYQAENGFRTVLTNKLD